MKVKDFALLIKNSFLQLLNNPVIILPSLALLLVLTLISKLLKPLTLLLTKNSEHIIWLSINSLFYLAIISFFFAYLLTLCFFIIKKNKISHFFIFKKTLHVWPRNFINTLIISLSWMIVFILSTIIGKLFLSVNVYLSIISFLFTMFLFMAGGIIFLAFTNVFTITHDFSIIKSTKASISLVKKQYHPVFFLLLLVYLVNLIVSKIFPELITEIIKTIIIVPCFALILVHLATMQTFKP